MLIIASSICFAQIQIEYLNDVSQQFKKKYYSQKREYNPLHVGNVWQYYNDDPDYRTYLTTRIIQDSVINGKKYFKKISYQNNPPTTNFVSWERNDTVSGVSFMLDFQDVNKNGDYLEDLPLDSLENPYWSRYVSYKYSFERPNPFSFFPGQKSVLIKHTNWVRIEGDTVIGRYFGIDELFWGEYIIEKFGVYFFNLESPNTVCTGAIINGRKYGTLVGIEEIDQVLPNEFILENNYPNPFNPSTTINYSIPIRSKPGDPYFDVKLIVYDALGREVATLVNERKSSGSYSVTFNGEGLSSGVYYYSLTAESKRITKSMIFIK
jgi:hypothetical protein